MRRLSKEEKTLMYKWKAEQRNKYILSVKDVEDLFEFLEIRLDSEPCDHTIKNADEWLSNNFEENEKEHIIKEIRNMGGFCDCEILMNCYEEYDIE